MTYRLILLRHGHSEWNAKNLFTGWVDVDLNAQGVEEAHRGGELLRDRGLLPDVLHTSLLHRAIRTANIALEVAGRSWIDVRRSWRLNERHYGALQGKDKKQTLEELGEEQFMLFRRSYDTPPPAIERGSEFDQANDPRYAALAPEIIPTTECLKDVVARMLPYWYDAIVPDLRADKTVLVTAHGNSLRALVKHLDNLDEPTVVGLNIPTGLPLLYELDEDLKPITPGGEYLDPNAAAAAIEAVKNQGPLTARAGEAFEASRAGTEVTELLVADVPAAGPTTAEGDPATGEWTVTTGAGFRIVPLWEGEALTGLYDADWEAAEGIGTAHLADLTEVLSAQWGPHHVITLDGPLLLWQQGQPVHPLFKALFSMDLYGELHVWHVDSRWIAVTVGHSDGDAPLVLAALVSTEEIVQPPGP